jgi:alkanesulfonate monooxygenase SsuD/methylene tetrahydromethanopterin reductase-like flavin-dependent oxidoreductase (luciferase family)
MTEINQAAPMLTSIRDYMAARGRKISVFTMGHVVCRSTRREAEEFYHYFAEEMADEAGQEFYRNTRGRTVGSGTAQMARPFDTRFNKATGERFAGAYPGAYPFVGTPDDIATEMKQLSEAGLAGTSIAFLDYLKEIPYFVQEVLPRLERLGLRTPI